MKLQRSLLIGAYYVLMGFWTIRACVLDRHAGIDLILTICISLSATLACIADSKLIARPMPHAAKWVMFFFWPIAVPIYLIWSRRARGFLYILVHLFATAGIVVGLTWFFVGVLGIYPR